MTQCGVSILVLWNFLYRKIFDELCLNDWLYGKDNKVFCRFCINGITSSEMLLKLHLFLEEQKRKIVKEI